MIKESSTKIMRDGLMKCDFGRVVFALPGDLHWQVLEGPVFWDEKDTEKAGRLEGFLGNKSLHKQQFVFREFAENGALGCIEGDLWRCNQLDDLKQNSWFQIAKIESLKKEIEEKEVLGYGEIDEGKQHSLFTTWVAQVKSEIALGNFSKIVAARKEKLSVMYENVDVLSTLEDLRMQFANALVFALQLGDEAIWIGCTPEKLMVLEKGLAHVHALAGTITKDQEHSWTSKEEQEQQVTHDFVGSILKQNDVVDFHSTAVQEVSMGDIKHLATEYVFSLSYGDVAHWIEQLHPTPAVGGWPQKEAWRWLNECEVLDRKFYAGWLGLLNPDVQEAHMFVTLRCAEISKEGVFLYAGGGINNASDPETEWKETAAKMNVIKGSLRYWED